MKVHNLPKVVTKNGFPRLGVEPGSLDPKANTLPTELSRPDILYLEVKFNGDIQSPDPTSIFVMLLSSFVNAKEHL